MPSGPSCVQLLSDFLERATLYSSTDLEADSDAVSLMTVHAAKGLEFPLVFIACMEDGVFPGRQALMSAEGLEEERRLAYVGITRARKKLTLCYAEQRRVYSQ